MNQSAQDSSLRSTLFGPINSLRRAFDRGEPLEQVVADYLKSVDVQDYYGHHRAPVFNDDDDGVIRFLLGRVWPETICDELGFTMAQLEARANQLGVITKGTEYNEEHVQLVKNMINNNCSYEEIADVLEIGQPKTFYQSTASDLSIMKEDAQVYIDANKESDVNQAELFGEVE